MIGNLFNWVSLATINVQVFYVLYSVYLIVSFTLHVVQEHHIKYGKNKDNFKIKWWPSQTKECQVCWIIYAWFFLGIGTQKIEYIHLYFKDL